MRYGNKRNKLADQCELLLYTLVSTLVFEGIARKLIPPLSMPIFFLKDMLSIAALFIIYNISLQGILQKISSIWLRLFILFLPLLLFTASKDPMLSVFAAKQYLSYIGVGILVSLAFPKQKEEQFRRFIFFVALLLIPTTVVAMMQNALPASHWINRSVGGETLEAFSAAGYLRVGSTFSFTGQYSWFLNAESFFLVTSFFMPPDYSFGLKKLFKPVAYSVLALMLVIGAFITGGRTAVLGCGATLGLGFVLLGIKRPGWILSKGVLILFFGLMGLSAVRVAKPEFFKAYDRRSETTNNVTQNSEILGRVIGGFTEWTEWFVKQDLAAILMGNGLGIMSNGSDKISSYASVIRANGFWTEGDVPTTFWEGGLYLGIIWYGFRISMILFCYKLWLAIKDKELSSAASVPLAYIVIHGLIAQFGIQPPLSLWWWLAIGIVVYIYRLAKSSSALPKKIINHNYEERHYIH